MEKVGGRRSTCRRKRMHEREREESDDTKTDADDPPQILACVRVARPEQRSVPADDNDDDFNARTALNSRTAGRPTAHLSLDFLLRHISTSRWRLRAEPSNGDAHPVLAARQRELRVLSAEGKDSGEVAGDEARLDPAEGLEAAHHALAAGTSGRDG